MTRLKRKGEKWRRKLPRPIRFRDGRNLVLLSDCRDYVLNLDEGVQGEDKWQRAAELILAGATGGDLMAVVDQFERILIHQDKIKLT